MREEHPNLPETQITQHDIEAELARRSKDPTLIKGLYESYGKQLQAAFVGREGEITQHGSQKVADWQARNLAELARDGMALDVGCGPRPEVSLRLARSGRRIVCSDISHDIVHLARTIAEEEDVRSLLFVVCDAEGLPFAPESFSLVVADDVIEHVPNPERLVSECARVIAPDGIVSISTPNRRAVSVLIDRLRDLSRGRLGPAERYFLVSSHLREYTRRELRDLCGRYFAAVDFAPIGWEGKELVKQLASRLTTMRPLLGLCRHWIVLLRRPLRAGAG